jgi:hypothetical protein
MNKMLISEKEKMLVFSYEMSKKIADEALFIYIQNRNTIYFFVFVVLFYKE